MPVEDAAQRWRTVREIFDAALSAAPAERAATVRAMTTDAGVAGEVFALLENHDRDDARLESGPGAFLSAVAAGDGEESLTGQHVGPYRLVREIGRGGMGTVYEAERDDAEYEKRVAVKVIRSGLNSDVMSRRFRRERQILAALDHPNVARLLDGAVTPDGRPYLVMELIDGEPIDDYCDARQLGMRDRITLFLRVCEAVNHAHRNLIVHRDLKPANILVTREGVPKLLDFGVAKLVTNDEVSGPSTMTGLGLQFFTPEYASPEQLRDEPVSTRSDVYSLGIVLYELLSGQQPFRADGRSAPNIERILATEPAPPSSVRGKLSRELDNIVMMALRKDPARRYTSVEQLAEDLTRYLDGRPVIATRDSAGYRLRKFVRRHRVGVAAAVVGAVTLAGGIAATAWQTHLARLAAARADVERAQAEQVTKFIVGILGSADPTVSNGGEKVGPKTTVLEAVQIASRRVGTDLAGQPEVEATVRRTIGNTYTALGRPDSGEAQIRMALALRRRAGAQPSLNLADDLGGLGGALYLQGKLAPAETALRQSLATSALVGDSTSIRLATNENNLAVVLLAMGRIAASESAQVATVNLVRRSTGEASAEMANGYNNLATLRGARGDLSGAERYLRKSLAVYAMLRGAESPQRGSALLNLAFAVRWRGHYAEADSLLHEALGVYERTGVAHPYAGLAYQHLAHLHYMAGRPALAETEIQRARTIFAESDEPPTHPNMLRTNVIESLILRDLGRLPEAEAAARRAFPTGAVPPPPHDPRTAEAIGALGRSLASRGKRSEAGPLLAQSHSDFTRAYGESDPRTQWAARADSLFRAGLPIP